MLRTPEEYLDSLEGGGREWLGEFLEYMKQAHADVPPIMFRQRPMYKVGKSYVLFSVAQNHFAVHTLNFDLIEALKPVLTRAEFGKGCAKVKFTDVAAKPVLKSLIDEVVRLNKLDDAPAVMMVSDEPYDVKLHRAFSASKAKWLPLYVALLERAKTELPDFVEYFPAVNVLWKHTSTFAQISAVAGALRLELYLDGERPELRPIKTVQTSKNRVAHTMELVDDSNFGQLIGLLAASYQLTKKA